MTAIYRGVARLPAIPGAIAGAAHRSAGYVARSVVRSVRYREFHDVPTRRTGVGLASAVFLDEAVLGFLTGSEVHPEDLEKVAANCDDIRRAARGRSWSDLHPVPPPLHSVSATSLRGAPARAEHLSAPSDYHPAAGMPVRDAEVDEAMATSHAYVLRHQDAARPWLIVIHGYRMGDAQDLRVFRSQRWHRAGFNVLHVVLPFHGPRRVHKSSGSGMVGLDHAATYYGVSQAAWDVRRWMGWVRDEGGSHVAIHGLSLGGYVAALTATFPDGPDRVVAGVPAVDLVPRPLHLPSRLRHAVRAYDLLGERARAVHALISPLAAPPLVPLEGRFIYAGVGDRIASVSHAHRLWQHWDRPAVNWFAGAHVAAMWSGEVQRFLANALQVEGVGVDQAASVEPR